jgi:hypothetical protein
MLRVFGDSTPSITKQLSRIRANGDGRNCVPNKDRADFLSVLESGHTIAVVPCASLQCRAARFVTGNQYPKSRTLLKSRRFAS